MADGVCRWLLNTKACYSQPAQTNYESLTGISRCLLSGCGTEAEEMSDCSVLRPGGTWHWLKHSLHIVCWPPSSCGFPTLGLPVAPVPRFGVKCPLLLVVAAPICPQGLLGCLLWDSPTHRCLVTAWRFQECVNKNVKWSKRQSGAAPKKKRGGDDTESLSKRCSR